MSQELLASIKDVEIPSSVNENGVSGIFVDDIFIPSLPDISGNDNNSEHRLMISHIENENFKSYEGIQTLGPFHSSFTSIVGPNGSGKSNIIDSILFVFGFRSKKIRTDKVSVLMNDTASQKHNVNFCKVTVFFHKIRNMDSGGINIVPGSQFSIARKGFKNNSSHYEINGKRAQFHKVAEYLRKEGIDIDHNRFLILQGEVEQIALLKPKGHSHGEHGMLEYLEDLIGSSRYKAPLNQVQERLNGLDEIRSEKLNRVKLVEKEFLELEAPRNEALEYLKLQNKIIQEKNKGYQRYILQYQNQIDKTEKERDEFQKTIDEKLSKLHEIRAKKNAKEKRLRFMEGEMMRLLSDLEETKEKFRKFELEDAQLLEEMKTVNIKRKKLMTTSKMEKEKSEKFQKIPELNKSKIHECEELLSKYQCQIDVEQKQYEEAIEKLKIETREFQDKKEKLETELISYTKNENESLSLLNIATSELEVLTGNEEKEKIKLHDLESRLEQSIHDQHEKHNQVKNKEKQIKEMESSLSKIEEEYNCHISNFEDLKTKARQTRTIFEETRSAQMATTSLSKVNDAIMKQNSIGALDGVIGRLGDLGIIDKKYDVAISTATHKSLDTILVQDVASAQSCIGFLKSKNIGRANFLALEKMKKYERDVNRSISTPENSPRLIDLIQVENQDYKLAFYHYLKDTLVAEDLDQANRITRTKNDAYRVVTLQGELIEKSGAMSGGGTQKMRGKMSFEFRQSSLSDSASYNEKSLRNLESRLQKEDLEVSRISEKTHHQESEVYNMKRDIDASKTLIKKLTLDVKKHEEETTILKEQINPQKALVDKAKPDETKVKELREKVGRLRQEHENVMARSKETKDSVQKLNHKIKEVGSNKVKSARNKLDSIKNQHGKVKQEITHLKVGIQSALRDLQKSKQKYEENEIEIKEAENKMQEMKKQREEFETKGKELIENLEELKSTETNGKQKILKMKDLVKLLEEEENTHKSDQIEIEQANEKYRTALKDLTRSLKHWRREKEQLILQSISGEEHQELEDYSSTEENKKVLESMDIENWQLKLTTMEEELSSKQPNLGAIEEYKQKELVYLARANELDDITNQRDLQLKNYETLRKMRLKEFMDGYGIITGKLKETYQLITLGGDAELELVDSLDPFTEGIIFSVRPPKKSWKNISNLSGGEKTLSSLALVFALHHYKPTPLYIMDEIDAALDFRNVSIIGRHIKEKTKDAQFIIVSLRSNMFELADRLIGIYKTYNCSKSVGVDPEKVESVQQPTTSN